MHTFAEKPKALWQQWSAKSTVPVQSHFGQNHEANSTLHSQRMIGNRVLDADVSNGTGDAAAITIPRFSHDFSRIPVHSNVPAKQIVSEEQQTVFASAFGHGKSTAIVPSSRGNFFTSLTTGEGDEEMIQTAVADGGAAPSNAVNTQVIGPGNPGPVAVPSSHHCVPTVKSSSLPSGHIAASVSGGRFAASFRMLADFDFPIPCSGVCGEYRQFVSGFFQKNGTDLVHALCGNTLSRTTPFEDCLTVGGTNLKYGYHSIPFANSRFTNPDQATGKSFQGFDAPGYNLAAFASGDVLNFRLSFRGELVDACDSDRSLQSSNWTVGGTYTVP